MRQRERLLSPIYGKIGGHDPMVTWPFYLLHCSPIISYGFTMGEHYRGGVWSKFDIDEIDADPDVNSFRGKVGAQPNLLWSIE